MYIKQIYESCIANEAFFVNTNNSHYDGIKTFSHSFCLIKHNSRFLLLLLLLTNRLFDQYGQIVLKVKKIYSTYISNKKNRLNLKNKNIVKEEDVAGGGGGGLWGILK